MKDKKYFVGFKVESDDDKAKEEILNLLESNKELGITLDELGITEEQLQDPKYQYVIKEDEGKDNEKFGKEEFSVINLYKYVSDSYGTSNIGSNSRNFCINLVSRTATSMFRYQDIISITPNPGFGKGGSNIYSVFKFRGGSNCKHYWLKFKYDTDTQSLVEAPIGEQPIQINKGSV